MLRVRIRRAWRSLKRNIGALGKGALIAILLIAIALEVITGFASGAYTRGQYFVFPFPLPVIGLVALGVAFAVNYVRKNLHAGFLLNFVVALFLVGMTAAYAVAISRFAFPQITSMILAALIGWQAWKALRAAWLKRPRPRLFRRKKAHGHGSGHGSGH